MSQDQLDALIARLASDPASILICRSVPSVRKKSARSTPCHYPTTDKHGSDGMWSLCEQARSRRDEFGLYYVS